MSMVFGFLLGLIFSWRLALLSLTVLPLMFISSLIQMKEFGKVRMGKSQNQNNVSLLHEAINNIKLVKSLNAESDLLVLIK